jgi:hypothetical protein
MARYQVHEESSRSRGKWRTVIMVKDSQGDRVVSTHHTLVQAYREAHRLNAESVEA